MPTVPGGLGDLRLTDAEVEELVSKIHDDIRTKVVELKEEAKELQLKAVAYKTQIVAGVNYFIKLKIGESNDFVHVRVYQDLQDNLSIHSITDLKKEFDEIEYFE